MIFGIVKTSSRTTTPDCTQGSQFAADTTCERRERSLLLLSVHPVSYAGVDLPEQYRQDERFDVTESTTSGEQKETGLYKAKQSPTMSISLFELPHSVTSRLRTVLIVIIVMLFSLAAIFVFSMGSASIQHTTAISLHGDRKQDLIEQSWAAYSPYFPVEGYQSPPSQCAITQVNILQRHGARYPTSGASTRIKSALKKLQSVTNYTETRLNFLKNFTYTLGQNDLVPFGAQQSQEAGRRTFERYERLVSGQNIPFVRSSGSVRVVDSAGNWTQGFSLASNHVYNPKISVILDENLNDTLDDHMCPNAGSSDEQTAAWVAIFSAPISERLNSQAPGANLTVSDIPNLISLCAFETVAKETLSPFCALFTASEFSQYEYYGDIDKYYGTGYGQPLGPVQGVGYINELLARLTEKPVRDNTQTNRTLDSSPITFPLNRTIYADFSHDNEIIAIYAALGLFKQAAPLDPTKPDANRTWITSHLTPFSGRMVTERLICQTGHGSSGERKAGTYVRILVSDALQPLEFCGAGEDGLCELDKFVESQAYARNDGDGDFEKCFS